MAESFTDDELYTQHHRQRRGEFSTRIEEDERELRETFAGGRSDAQEKNAPGDWDERTERDDGVGLDGSPSSSYYAILNVPRDATMDAIKSAYRTLVSTIHPDKIRDEAHKKAAEAQFIRIQTAYDVLKDERLRAVYDVYGEDGLQAGMELATSFTNHGNARQSSVSESDVKSQKKLFEEFLRQKEHREQATSSVTKGVYVFRTDATAAVAPYRTDAARHMRLSRTPQITTVYMSTGIDIPIDPSSEALDWLPDALSSEQDSLHLGGMVMSAPGGSGQGGGSFVAGYHRFYGNGVQVGAEGSVGLQTLVGASVSVPIVETVVMNTGVQCDWSSGERVVSWDVGTSKQLGDETSAEFAWTVWPLAVSTMSFTLKHKIVSSVGWLNRTILIGKLELGAVTGVTLRVMRQLTDVLSGRASVKVSVTQGFEVELGGFGRLGNPDPVKNPNPATAGLGVVTAIPAGVMLRLRFQKSGHNFEFPVLLSPVLDPTIVAGAHILPPAIIYAALHGIISPASRFLHKKRIEARRAKQTAAIQQELASSLEAIGVIRPVAIRKMRREAGVVAEGNLVIVKALYGEAELLKDDRIQIETFDSCVARTPEDVVVRGITVVDVTVPVQYLCEKSVVEFYKGFSKSKLFGFCDVCPGVEKMLVMFTWSAGNWYKVELGDSEGARVVSGVGKRLGATDRVVSGVLMDALATFLTTETSETASTSESTATDNPLFTSD